MSEDAKYISPLTGEKFETEEEWVDHVLDELNPKFEVEEE